MICPNCGSEMPEGSKFCTMCGEAVTQNDNMTVGGNAPAQGSTLQNNAAYQQQTNNMYAKNDQSYPQGSIPTGQGAYAGQNPEFVQNRQYSGTVQNYQNDSAAKQKKPKKKGVTVAVCVAAAVAVIAAAVVLLFHFGVFNKSEQKPLIYATDSSLYLVESLGKDEAKTVEISDDYAGSYLLSGDNKYIVYTEDYEENDNGGTYDIYLKQLAKADGDATKIASGASSLLAVSDNCDTVLYGKNDNIYKSNSKGDSDKLADDASLCAANDDYSKIVTAEDKESDGTDESEETVYTVNVIDVSNAEKTKISDKASYPNVSGDSIYFTENDTFYKSDFSANKTKIADKVENYIVGSQAVYYIVLDKEYTYYDFVNDSYKDSDSKAQYPEWDDYAPDSSKYDDYNKYYEAYDKANEKYNKAYEEYQAAESRNYIRESLGSDTVYSTCSLYCYTSDNKKVLGDVSYAYAVSYYDKESDDVAYGSMDEYCSEYAWASIYTTPLEKINKIDIDDIDSYSPADSVYSALESQIKTKSYIVNSAKTIEITGLDEFSYLQVRYSQKSSQFIIFALDESDSDSIETDNVSLYTLKDSADSFDDAELVSDKLCGGACVNGKFVLFKNLNDDCTAADMSLSGDKVDNDVYPYYIYCDSDDDAVICYFTDYDSDNATATVWQYKNGESTKIAKDVSVNYFTAYDGKYIALSDYDSESNSGKLVCIDGEDKYTIDKDVKSFSGGSLSSVYCSFSE